MNTFHTLVVYLDSRLASVERVVLLLRRKNFRVRSLALHPAGRAAAETQLVVAVEGPPQEAARLRTNLEKLLDVRRVVSQASHADARCLALVRVESGAAEPGFVRLCQEPGVRVFQQEETSTTLEITGTDGHLDAWLPRLAPFGITEISRTGAISLTAEPGPSAALGS